ncbi:hypothetical protein TNCV_2063841 [Trichonephila clavipes]|nr:hypothetical protein TNCV_2063841 [Trichonephila clavipes]
MYASSSSVNPTPLAHADTQRDVDPRGENITRVLCGVPRDLPSGHEGSTPALYFVHAFYQVPRPPSFLMDPSSMVTKLQKRGSLSVGNAWHANAAMPVQKLSFRIPFFGPMKVTFCMRRMLKWLKVD